VENNETKPTDTNAATGGDMPAPIAFDDGSAFRAAYERRLAEITAVKDPDLFIINIDPHVAVATVLGALPEIKSLRPALSTLPTLNQALVDGLEDYAQAAGEANSRYVTAMTPQEDIVALNESALKLRETLRSDATALANRGLIDRARLAPFKGEVGYRNVAFELIDWANLLRDCWAQIEGKTALTSDELAAAKKLGERLVRAAGLRDQAPSMVAEVARLRQQAMTLLMDSYEEVRRGIGYLRYHEEDADTIAPSLYANRKRKAVQGDDPTEPGPAPTQAAPAPGTTAAPAHVTPPVAPGLPGASPFTSN
jgi:hypothetical protein